MISPFFGGGSIELHYAAQGVKVYGYDIFEPLTNFWQHAIPFGSRMATLIENSYHPCSKEQFKQLQSKVVNMKVDPFLRACFFYVINRSSFSGATLSAGYSKQAAEKRFTKASIDMLRDFACDNLIVQCASYENSLARHDDETFIYADPPYLLEKSVARGLSKPLVETTLLYGQGGSTHKDFDHERFAEEIKKKNNWVISYNPHPEILELYKDYEIVYPNWTYGMSADKKSKEILILNVKENKDALLTDD